MVVELRACTFHSDGVNRSSEFDIHAQPLSCLVRSLILTIKFGDLVECEISKFHWSRNTLLALTCSITVPFCLHLSAPCRRFSFEVSEEEVSAQESITMGQDEEVVKREEYTSDSVLDDKLVSVETLWPY